MNQYVMEVAESNMDELWLFETSCQNIINWGSIIGFTKSLMIINNIINFSPPFFKKFHSTNIKRGSIPNNSSDSWSALKNASTEAIRQNKKVILVNFPWESCDSSACLFLGMTSRGELVFGNYEGLPALSRASIFGQNSREIQVWFNQGFNDQCPDSVWDDNIRGRHAQ